MKWIDAKALEEWAKRTTARADLISMVGDLIRASIADATRFRFPAGDSAQLRGWDGDLETSDAVDIIPSGESKWEFGVSPGEAKATSDYEKRTAKTEADVMARNTLVLVNPTSWNVPRSKLTEWEEIRKAENKWKNVIYVDGVVLEHWLEQCPAVAARYARDILQTAPQEGALSTDEYWAEYSSRFAPALSEAVVIADRNDDANRLLQQLSGPAQIIHLGTESPEEVVVFAIAAIRTADEVTRRTFESRTLIVESERAARFLSQKKNLVFIATKGAEPLTGLLGNTSPTLCAVTGVQARNAQSLPRPSASSMVDGFVAMGYSREDAYEQAQRCGRSLTILRRLIPRGPAPQPEWLALASQIKAALLAGGWSTLSGLDKELLCELSGLRTYAEVETLLFPTLGMSDKPFERVSDVWKARAPVDAFHFYGQQVGTADIQRLRACAIKVFSHAIERPSPDAPYQVDYNPPADYSNWLREGIGLTLLIMVTMHEVAGFHIDGSSPQAFVDEIVSSLPDWGKTQQSIVALGSQTALLAEVAPRPFLLALESILEGANLNESPFFSNEKSTILASRSPHIEVLWALEALAWDPRSLVRSCGVLAKLAAVDPDPQSNHANRPLKSLRSILLPWSPNTHANVTQRITCLDTIVTKHTNIAWELLLALLPTEHDTSWPTHRPLLRDSTPEAPEVLTYAIVWQNQSWIVTRALSLAESDEDRLATLVDRFAAFRVEDRSIVLAKVDEYLLKHQRADGNRVWHQLKSQFSRHEYFAASDWALQDEERKAIGIVIERHKPSDPIADERLLFDDWLPQYGRYDSRASYDNADTIRSAALTRIIERDGIEGVVRLARVVKLPNLVAKTIDGVPLSQLQLQELIKLSLTTPIVECLAICASAIGIERYGVAWSAWLRSNVLVGVESFELQARLLIGWPLVQSTWSFVDSIGVAVADAYWRQINVLPLNGDVDTLLLAIEEFKRHQRSLDAIGLIGWRIKEIPTGVLQDLLTAGQLETATAIPRLGTMLSYYIGEVLKELQSRTSVERLDIARLEYAYLPLIEFSDEKLVIVDVMAEDPNLFVEVLCHVFRADNQEEPPEPTEEERARAHVSFRLLSLFKRVPGLRGAHVNFEELSAWVHGARAAAHEAARGAIGDQYIGHVLAHAPVEPEGGSWPPDAVCSVIETIASSQIERGIQVECFNKRGVYSKALAEGGKQELDLAETYTKWAEGLARFPRTADLLLSIADDWRRQAKDEDVRAEKDRLTR